MDPMTMTLPQHLREEAVALKSAAALDNPVTESQARPLMTASYTHPTLLTIYSR